MKVKNEKRYSNNDVLGFDFWILLNFELNDQEDLNEFCSWINSRFQPLCCQQFSVLKSDEQ